MKKVNRKSQLSYAPLFFDLEDSYPYRSRVLVEIKSDRRPDSLADLIHANKLIEDKIIEIKRSRRRTAYRLAKKQLT